MEQDIFLEDTPLIDNVIYFISLIVSIFVIYIRILVFYIVDFFSYIVSYIVKIFMYFEGLMIINKIIFILISVCLTIFIYVCIYKVLRNRNNANWYQVYNNLYAKSTFHQYNQQFPRAIISEEQRRDEDDFFLGCECFPLFFSYGFYIGRVYPPLFLRGFSTFKEKPYLGILGILYPGAVSDIILNSNIILNSEEIIINNECD